MEKIYDLPEDGQVHDIPGVGRAVHYPLTKMQQESVIVETASGETYRRRKIRGFWNPAEEVDGLQRSTDSAGHAKGWQTYVPK